MPPAKHIATFDFNTPHRLEYAKQPSTFHIWRTVQLLTWHRNEWTNRKIGGSSFTRKKHNNKWTMKKSFVFFLFVNACIEYGNVASQKKFSGDMHIYSNVTRRWRTYIVRHEFFSRGWFLSSAASPLVFFSCGLSEKPLTKQWFVIAFC